ncbi:MAG: hypothetical protein K8R21_08165 [Leptospira sp.]|nr:hypothetical protein [Leptospira sp.]
MVHSFESSDEKGRPFLCKFWNHLPAYGETAIIDGSWYTRVSHDKITKLISKEEYKNSFQLILNFEKLLTNDNYMIQKYFLHIPSHEQKSRLKKAKESGKKWLVSDGDWEQFEKYDTYLEYFENYLNKTNHEAAPWHVISATDKSFARFTIMDTIITNLEKKLGVDSAKILSLLKEEAGVS